MTDPPRIDRECVEAYLYTPRPKRLLLLHRPPIRRSIWVPVSGKVEPQDRDYRTAVRREIREETGFLRFRRLFDLDWTVIFPVQGRKLWRLHAFGAELNSPRSPRLSSEHNRFEWVSFPEARRRLHYRDNREAVNRLRSRLQDGQN